LICINIDFVLVDLSQLIPGWRVVPGLADLSFQDFVVLGWRVCHPRISWPVILRSVILGASRNDGYLIPGYIPFFLSSKDDDLHFPSSRDDGNSLFPVIPGWRVRGIRHSYLTLLKSRCPSVCLSLCLWRTLCLHVEQNGLLSTRESVLVDATDGHSKKKTWEKMKKSRNPRMTGSCHPRMTAVIPGWHDPGISCYRTTSIHNQDF
jgi:hypothetical protein